MVIAYDHARDAGHVAARLGAFVQTLEGTTSLALLRQIDDTVDTLLARGKAFRGLAGLAGMLAENVASLTAVPNDFIDPDDGVVRELKAAYDLVEGAIPKLLRGKAGIDADTRLQANHCDLLHSAYDEAIGAAGAMVEAMKDLRAAIIRHDLAAEPRDGGDIYETTASLIGDLRTTRAP